MEPLARLPAGPGERGESLRRVSRSGLPRSSADRLWQTELDDDETAQFADGHRKA